MPRHAQQIEMDKLLVKAAVAKIPLNSILTDAELVKLGEIRSKINKNTKETEFPELEAINKKLAENLKTPEVAVKIKEVFMREGALAQADALKIISTQDPKLVVPVIINIIEDLQNKINRHEQVSSKVIKFVEAALAKIKDVDATQNLSEVGQWNKIKDLTKKQIKEEMMPLIKGAAGLVFNNQEIANWFEAIIWLEGHFLREHNKALTIAKNQKELKYDGAFKSYIFKKIIHGNGAIFVKEDDHEIVGPIDEEDWKFYMGKGEAFFSGTGCTKHLVNSHFHAVAVLLEYQVKNKLKLNFKTVDVFPTSIVAESPVKDFVGVITNVVEFKPKEESNMLSTSHVKQEAKPSSSTADLTINLSKLPKLAKTFGYEVADGTFPYDTQKLPDGRLLLITSIPPETTLERIDQAEKSLTQALDPTRQGLLVDRLKLIQKTAKDPRFSKDQIFSLMLTAFKQSVLSGKEDAIMRDYIDDMETHIKDNYLNARTAGPSNALFKRPTMPYKHRKYKPEVDKMWEEIRKVDDDGRKKSATEVIEIVKKAHKAAKDAGSETLYDALETMSVKLCDHFVTCLESTEEKKLSTSMIGRK